MKHLKSWLSVLLTMVLLMGCVGGSAETAAAAPAQTAAQGPRLTLADIEAHGATAYTHDGRVTFVDGACTDAPVRGVDDAAVVVNSMITLLGGGARTQFEPWRSFEDPAGNIYYVFQQIYARTTVPGGAVKVVTDAEGNMLGLIGSVAHDLPDVAEAEGITAEQAEALALQYIRDNYPDQAELVEGRTEKAVLPVHPEIDLSSEIDRPETRFVWVVYTNNPGGRVEAASDLPYLAHYVTMSGEYLYSLPTIIPGDVVATTGSHAAYVFEFMEPVDYTGPVTFSDGTEREITVTLMRDSRTGMYYLGNIERRIVVGDCYEFLYNHGHVVLEASPDNTGWDNTCLLSFYNYCRAWDYYQAIGWTGGDGMGTPMLVLKDFCNSYHEPIDNAAYAGHFYGWQTFLSSDVNDFSQCLDVLAHEFTHCVTGSLMTYNAYLNDYGSINEAMSDIQGNICEMMAGATEDTTWALGENSSAATFRSMSDPHQFRQPEYSWDYHYRPNVKSPTPLNDQGGVHTNSSLLNNVAYRLCEKGGMTLEEAQAFWFAVDCSMVPGTDYAQLSELMPWVLENLGMGRYRTELEAAIDATRLHSNDVPDTFDADRALITLTLPDDEIFQDGHWGLGIISVDAESLEQRVKGIIDDKGEYEGTLERIVEILFPEDEGPRPGDAREDAADFPGKMLPRLIQVFETCFGDLVRSGTGVAGQDGRTIQLVCGPGLTVPVLFRLEFDSDEHIVSTGLAIYTFGSWLDVATAVAPALEAFDPVESAGSGLLDAFTKYLESYDRGDDFNDVFSSMDDVIDMLRQPRKLIDRLFFRIERGTVNRIPATGLETVGTLNSDNFPLLDEFNAQIGLQGTEGPEAASLIDFGDSELYTRADLEAAVARIMEQFVSFEGCELHSLRYAGDVCNSEGNIRWMNALSESGDLTQVAEFLCDFHSPVEGGGAWDADTEYTDWQWWLAREEGGEWQLLTCGY
ncbi:MAG: M4 family metallopeptidase [Clostridia bacterium]|nr:M4 family metallopeptidase [Clostridia bacterium]